jgi:hypothetical protein
MILTPSEHPHLIIKDPPREFYISPLHSEVEQSAIYQEVNFDCIREKCLGIVLTSQCDISFSHPLAYILLARIAPVLEIYFLWLIENKKISDTEIEKAREEENDGMILKYAKDFTNSYLKNKKYQYHFLPALPDYFDDSLVCFDLTTCVKRRDLKSDNKICVLQSPFREAVPTRYSAYAGRIGTADLDEKYLSGLIEKNWLKRVT